MIPLLHDLELTGRRVLVRADLNVPVRDSEVGDDTRIRAALPTLRELQERGATVVLASHLGRPKGVDESARMGPVAARLSELLGRE
ncbi:MAG: phosphoglycerate kinase, partial [Trueperaceae bacterium]